MRVQKAVITLLIPLSIWLSCDNPEEPDTTPPSVTITQPINGSTLDSLTIVKANAIDDKGVKNVVFYIDGVSAYTDTESPYVYVWDICVFDNSEHTILVEVEDNSGNKGQSDLVTVTTNGFYDGCSVCGGNGVDNDEDGVCDDADECVGAILECGCNLGIPEGDCDCDGNVEDCVGECGGDAVCEPIITMINQFQDDDILEFSVELYNIENLFATTLELYFDSNIYTPFLEDFDDLNGNGLYDYGEPFEDINSDGICCGENIIFPSWLDEFENTIFIAVPEEGKISIMAGFVQNDYINEFALYDGPLCSITLYNKYSGESETMITIDDWELINYNGAALYFDYQVTVDTLFIDLD